MNLISNTIIIHLIMILNFDNSDNKEFNKINKTFLKFDNIGILDIFYMK